jgi:LmbE family N-acetylglucosaminyl deacetylase
LSNLALMAVFAHPDDEAFGTGGTLSKYAAEGCDVHLVTATRGEAGEIAEESLATTADLPFVREQELRCACEIYGIHPPRFLDYPDVHRWTTIAVDMAADSSCFPHHVSDTCEPHQVSKLYFRVMPEEELRAREENGEPRAMMMDGVPFRFVGRPLDEITTIIDVGEYVEQKVQGIQCHATQVGRESRFTVAREKVLCDPALQKEYFMLARSGVGWPEGVETDLFAGLR